MKISGIDTKKGINVKLALFYLIDKLVNALFVDFGGECDERI
jgi:hypothetical protein